MPFIRLTLPLFLTLSLWGLLTGCQWLPTNWQELRHQDQFALQVPEFLSPTERLAADAALQLQDKHHELFLVLHYADLDSLYERRPSYATEDYYDFHAANLTEPLRETQASAVDTVAIGGLTGLSGSFEGVYREDRLYLRLVVLEGEHCLYQLLTWTTEAHREQMQPTMERMIASFRELPTAKPSDAP
jgi:hypothetical protein